MSIQRCSRAGYGEWLTGISADKRVELPAAKHSRANARLTQPLFAFTEGQFDDAGCGENMSAVIGSERTVEVEELRELDRRILVGKFVTTDDDRFREGIADVHHVALRKTSGQVGLQ